MDVSKHFDSWSGGALARQQGLIAGGTMYAVIRAGGKQYRVAPGDVIRIEKAPADNGMLEFTDILAVSGGDGQIGRPESGARVVGSVVEEGRSPKVLVFHYKRKKQYKKLAGHRQGFTAVRITEIAFDGQRFTAPELPAKPAKQPKAPRQAASETGEAPAPKLQAGAKGKGGGRATGKKSAGKGGTKSAKKKTGSKKKPENR
jgi:large subunit ribosomal protein L21